MFYAISAQVTLHRQDGSSLTRQVPIFFLHSNVQGIVDASHAEDIAQDLLRTGMERDADVTIHVQAIPQP